jgi:hypothetical protein
MTMSAIRDLGALCGLVISCHAPLWCQASLTGHVRNKNGNSGINGASVSVSEGGRSATTNTDGWYRISGLKLGQKVHAVYQKAGYGPSSGDVTLSDKETVCDVPLYQEWGTATVGYYGTIFVSARKSADSAVDSQTRSRIYTIAWNDLDSSALSPKAKAAAAYEFQNVIDVQSFYAPGSLRDYGQVNVSTISNVETDFGKAIRGEGRITRTASVPPSVAADIAAKELYDWGNPHEMPAVFLVDFKERYGTKATDILQYRVAKGNSAGQRKLCQ